MKRLALAATSLIMATFFTPVAQAGSQQDRMTQCNADAKTKNLSGEPRKAFMKDCLSGKTQGATPATPGEKGSPATKTTPATPPTQQDKMKSCNKEASDKGLKGDERKTFMSGCLKG